LQGLEELKEQRIFETEAMILGIFLNDCSVLEDSKLTEKYFSSKENRALYKHMQDLYKKEGNFDLTDFLFLPEEKLHELGGRQYIQSIYDMVLSVHSYPRHEKKLHEYWATKKAEIAVKKYLDENIVEPEIETLDELVTKLQDIEKFSVQPNESFSQKIAKRIGYHVDLPAEGISGIDTGYGKLNDLTDGWQNGDLILIGARPSMGKTAFMLNLMVNGHTNQRDTKHVFFSLEMGEGSVIDRLIAMIGKINVGKMRNPNKYLTPEDFRTKYNPAYGTLSEMDFEIVENMYKVSEQRSYLRKLKKDNPHKKIVVYIDFLTLMKPENKHGNKHGEVDEIITNVKRMAVNLGIPVIVLSQLNRGIDSRADKRPTMMDLRESGSIEQLADIVMLLHREAYYDPEVKAGNVPDDNVLQVMIEKFRNGTTKTLKFEFIKTTQRIREL
jgi:replicative DNA helicase